MLSTTVAKATDATKSDADIAGSGVPSPSIPTFMSECPAAAERLIGGLIGTALRKLSLDELHALVSGYPFRIVVAPDGRSAQVVIVRQCQCDPA